MSEAPTRDEAARRAELVRLLEERARLLAPPPDLVERAIARCIRQDLRTQRGEEQAHQAGRGSSETEAVAITPVSSAPAAAEPASSHGTEQTVPESLGQAPVTLGDGLPRGRVIAGYRIESVLGKGGMGQVYRALQLSVQREVAFKMLSPRLALNPSFRERFLREARAAGRLHHPNLIGVHDVGEASGMMFFSMELVEGRTVKELIATSGTLPLERALGITAQTLAALQYAHERGVIHRDIKPDNIMVTDAGLVKVADLGLSRIESLTADETQSASASTQAGTIMGTPHYMSPEQGRDAHAADLRSDLYSLGATLFHMLCGRPPFTGTSPVDVVMKAATQPLVFPEPGPTAGARALIAKLMAKKPEERPSSAAEALTLLERARQGGGIEHSRRTHRVGPRRRRLRSILPIVAVAALSVLLAIAAIAISRRNTDAQAWAHERQRIENAAQEGEWRRALELAQAALQDQPSGSTRAREAEEARDDIQARWDTWSAETIRPALSQFADAARDKRFVDAEKALKVEREDALSPSARQQLDARREQLDRALDEQLQKPADTRAGDEAARDQWRRLRAKRLAPRMWGHFAWNPTSAAERTESGVTLHGTGAGTLPFPTSPAGATLRQVDLLLRFAALPVEGERLSLQVGRARIDIVAAGVTAATSDGRTETLSVPRAESVLHLRRMNDVLQVSAKEGVWVALATIEADAKLQLSWTLKADHNAELAMLPTFELIK